MNFNVKKGSITYYLYILLYNPNLRLSLSLYATWQNIYPLLVFFDKKFEQWKSQFLDGIFGL